MSARSALHLLYELTRLEVVDRSSFEMVIACFRKHRRIDRSWIPLNAECANRAPFDQIRINGEARILQNQAYCGWIENPDGNVMRGTSGEDRTPDPGPMHHRVEVSA